VRGKDVRDIFISGLQGFIIIINFIILVIREQIP
jgi:hypothetical protein